MIVFFIRKSLQIASQITFSIKDGNEDDAFLIEPQTGKIKTKKRLDYEKITAVSI